MDAACTTDSMLFDEDDVEPAAKRMKTENDDRDPTRTRSCPCPASCSADGVVSIVGRYRLELTCERCNQRLTQEEDFDNHVRHFCDDYLTVLPRSTYNSADVGPEGGQISLEGSGISLTIPPGALMETITVSVRLISKLSVPVSPLNKTDNQLVTGYTIFTAPDKYPLLKPAIVRVPHPENVPKSIIESIYEFNNEERWWDGHALCGKIDYL